MDQPRDKCKLILQLNWVSKARVQVFIYRHTIFRRYQAENHCNMNTGTIRLCWCTVDRIQNFPTNIHLYLKGKDMCNNVRKG